MQKDGGGNEYYYLNNAHGDVVGLVDSKGTVVNSYKYDAFGNIVEAKEQVHNRFKYAGEQFDQVTGQYYLRARFYNPVVGRFTQEDTYRGDGLNLYAYVANNPVNYVDPSGYCGEKKENPFGKYSTAIDDNVTVIDKQVLPEWIKDTFTDGEYSTVVTNEDITLYRVYGGRAEATGSFVTTQPAVNRIQTKIDSALLPEWGGTREFEAEIVVPKGTVLNIGKVAPQTIKSTGTVLKGGADQVLLPQNWPKDWIRSTRKVLN
jgi:RHS repeat-associated protein